jgi:Spy/CpxP family protein refolding chaperone
MKKIVLLLLLLVVAVPPAFSLMSHEPMKPCQDCDMHKPEMGGMMVMGGMDRMGEMMGMCLANAEKIGLTPDQIKKITPIHREMQKKHVRFNADLKIAEMEQMEIMEVRDFDLEKAGAAVKKCADIKTAHHLDILKSMKEARAILTDEQFKKMKQLMPMKMGGGKPGKKMEHTH